MAFESFNVLDNYPYYNDKKDDIKRDIESEGKEYILGVNESDYKSHLIDKYTLSQLEIIKDSEQREKPKESSIRIKDYWGEVHNVPVYECKVTYLFNGSAILFKIRPQTRYMTSTAITVDEHKQTVSFIFTIDKADKVTYEKEKFSKYDTAFCNIERANLDARNWNDGLPGIINSIFNGIKEKHRKENDFFEAINLNVNKDTAAVYTVDAIRPKIIPQPIIDKNKEFTAAPTIANKVYVDILRVLHQVGRIMETKPSMYKGKDEEGIRDTFLSHLETRYDGATAHGEAFNSAGKTDILVKNSGDNGNVFVAECKVWTGMGDFFDAISQLFDRYLTWRDSKTALLIFVKNKSFTKTINTVECEISKHPYFKRSNGKHDATSLSYIFSLPQDKDKDVFLEVILFHFDK